MKFKVIIIIITGLLALASGFLFFHNFILAAGAAPTVTFSGDDLLQISLKLTNLRYLLYLKYDYFAYL